MRSSECSLVQYEWGPYKQSMRNKGWRCTHRRPVKAQWEGSCLEAKERGLKRVPSCWHLGLGLSASWTAGNKFALKPQLVAFCYCNSGKNTWHTQKVNKNKLRESNLSMTKESFSGFPIKLSTNYFIHTSFTLTMCHLLCYIFFHL